METDERETKNLADSLKAKTEELAGELKKWRGDVGAQMPVVNKKFEGGGN